MSIKAITWAWKRSAEKSTRLLLLLAIADHCGDDGVCYPSVGFLAKKCRVSVRRAQQVIEALKHAGELRVEIGGGVDIHGGKTNRYYLARYRRSIGLPPAPDTPDGHSPPEATGGAGGGLSGPTHPAASFGALPAASGTLHPETAGGVKPQTDFTTPPQTDCTTLPATDCIQTVSINRYINHHSPNTHGFYPTSARVREANAVDVCVGEGGFLEEDAFLWASEHPFWSTRITNREALRRNLAEGKAFRAQFLAAQAATDSKQASPSGHRESQHATHKRVFSAAEDYHTAFWKRFGGAVRGTLLDPKGGH